MSKLYEALMKAEAESLRRRKARDGERARESFAIGLRSFFWHRRNPNKQEAPAGKEREDLVPQQSRLPSGLGVHDGERWALPAERAISLGGAIRFEKNLKAGGGISSSGDVVIDRGIEVQANVSATRIIVGGTVTGNLTALEAVEVFPTGAVRGGIRTKKLLVHEGASIIGELQAGPPPNGGVEDLKEALRQFQKITDRLRAVLSPLRPKATP